MKREEKYKTTKWFKFYNANPKGKIVGDCVIRALCTAVVQSWEDTYIEAVCNCAKKGLPCDDAKGIDYYLTEFKGFEKMKQPRKFDNTKYTGKQFCDYLNANKEIYEGRRIVANIGGYHTVCIMEDPADYRFKVYDHWDSTNGTIGNWWISKD